MGDVTGRRLFGTARDLGSGRSQELVCTLEVRHVREAPSDSQFSWLDVITMPASRECRFRHPVPRVVWSCASSQPYARL